MTKSSHGYYQKKAVRDVDNNKYDPPLNSITEIGASDKAREYQKAYDDSWRNHRNQTHKK